MTLRPLCWFRYRDDKFVIWPHGPEVLVPPEWPTREYRVPLGDTERKLPSFSRHGHLLETIMSTRNLPTHTSSTVNHITILPATSHPRYLDARAQPCAIGTAASVMSWSSLIPLCRKTEPTSPFCYKSS